MKTAPLNTVLGFVRRIAVHDGIALSDRELLERFLERHDQPAFAELVRRHGPMVLAASRRILRHEQDAEDVFQAAFLVLARRAGSIRRCESLGGWLYQVTYRLAIRARQIGIRRGVEPLPADLEGKRGVADWQPLDDELARLPEQYRSVIVLCYLEGRTQGEAARILATTPDAVNGRLKRARDLLRLRYAQFGIAALAGIAAGPALSHAAVTRTVEIALEFSTHGTCAASATALQLAKGACSMLGSTSKLLATILSIAGLLIAGIVFAASTTDDPKPELVAANDARSLHTVAFEPGDKKPGCIILWMSGGPSQQDTFDPKPGVTALFRAIDTNVKGVQFSETLPKLAKQAHHLAVIRSMTHREGDHARGMYLMHTSQLQGGPVTYPSLGCLLGKELGESLTSVPRLVCMDAKNIGPGYLGAKYAPLQLGTKQLFLPPPNDPTPVLPDEKVFAEFDKDNGKVMRKNLEKAFDLAGEKAATRDAYGRSRFGNSCLIARRLREAGVPVIEVTLGGWDTHGNAIQTTKPVAADLDAGFAALVSDLHDKKLLDQTLIVWLGEFGRTPRVNNAGGRDHYPQAFSAVLAGASIKGGTVIGKTSGDGVQIDERPVSPAELHATIYQALGIDPTKKHRVEGVGSFPYVETGTKALKEALR